MTGEARGFVIMTEGILPVLCLEGVYVDRSIGGLRSNVFIQGIPGHPLDIVTVLSNLSDKRT